MCSALVNREKKVSLHCYLQSTFLHSVEFLVNMDVMTHVPCQPTYLCLVHVDQLEHSGHIFSYVCGGDGICILQFHLCTHMTQHIIAPQTLCRFPIINWKYVIVFSTDVAFFSVGFFCKHF